MIELSDEDILARLTNIEDSTVERKTAADYRDCLKTATAFSNSLPILDPGIVFVGVFDDGRVQENPNLDSVQKKINEQLNKIYPPIYPQIKVMRKEGKPFLAVIVRGSPERPHFAGPSFVRKGSESVNASEEQFSSLIAERSGKSREILKWKFKAISLDILHPPDAMVRMGRISGSIQCTVQDCNQHWVTLHMPHGLDAYPIRRVELAYDHTKGRLKLELSPL